MPSYIGFSTVTADLPRSTSNNIGVAGQPAGPVRAAVYGKKFRLVDEQLVIQDLINALNIRKGEKVGQPGYGTTIWSFVFEPNNSETQQKIQQEIQRIVELDPRLDLNYILVYPRDNGILLEVELAVTPYNQPRVLNVFFDEAEQTATIL